MKKSLAKLCSFIVKETAVITVNSACTPIFGQELEPTSLHRLKKKKIKNHKK